MRQKISHRIMFLMQLVNRLLQIVRKDWQTISLVALSLLPLNVIICFLYDQYGGMITIAAQVKNVSIASLLFTSGMVLLLLNSMVMTFALSILLLAGSNGNKPMVIRALWRESLPLGKLLIHKLAFMLLLLTFIGIALFPTFFMLSLLMGTSVLYALYIILFLCLSIGLAIIQKSWYAPKLFLVNALPWKEAMKKSRQVLKGKVLRMYTNTFLLMSILWIVPIMLYIISWILREEVSFLLYPLITKIVVATCLQFFFLLFCIAQNILLEELEAGK